MKLKIHFSRILPKHEANVFNFLYRINKFMRSSLLIGHNTSTFDTPLLLHSTLSTFSARLKSLRIIFADSLDLNMKQLQSCSINSALLSNLPNNLYTLYAGLFKEEFNAHDALEYVKALPKIPFHSSIPSSYRVQQILEHGRSTTVEDAIKNVQFLNQRHAIIYRRV